MKKPALVGLSPLTASSPALLPNQNYAPPPALAPHTPEFEDAFIKHLGQHLPLTGAEAFCQSFPKRFALDDEPGRTYLVGLVKRGVADGRIAGPTFIARMIEFLAP